MTIHRGPRFDKCRLRLARDAREAAQAVNRMRAGDPRHACQADRRDPGADPAHRGADDADSVGRHPGLGRGGRHRHVAQRDDRVVVLRVRDRAGDARLLHLEVPGEAGRRVRRRAHPREREARDHVDRDPDRDRPLRSDLQLDRAREPREQGVGCAPPRHHRAAVQMDLQLSPVERQGGELEHPGRARGAPARHPPDGARRDPLVLGAGVADQARRGAGGGGRQRHRQHGRGDARTGSAPTTWSAPSSAGLATRPCGHWSGWCPRGSSTSGCRDRSRSSPSRAARAATPQGPRPPANRARRAGRSHG